MSSRYPGGIITKSPATPTGPYDTGAAPGIWTLEQQLQYKQQGVWPTAGLQPPFIEDVFSTYLYTGNGSTQTITNGIDLAGEGGLVWTKSRSNVINHGLIDTARGVGKLLYINSGAEGSGFNDAITSFNSTGYSLGADAASWTVNKSAYTYCSWTFRKQPKFFEICTWVGNGVAGRSIAHNLGSLPGCIIVKATSIAGQDWFVYHRSLSTNGYLLLNSTGAQSVYPYVYNPTTTTFDVASSVATNGSGTTYVAYLFAHNAGGFGLTGTDNVISCGSVTTSGQTNVNLGWEPQFVIIKMADGTNNWHMVDNMRGWAATNDYTEVRPNTSDAEASYTNNSLTLNSTGFQLNPTVGSWNGNGTYIYIAIRRGPMKVPTSGTSVFDDVARTGTGTATTVVSGFPVDLFVCIDRTKTSVSDNQFADRLRGQGRILGSNDIDAELNISGSNYMGFDAQNGVKVSAADNPFFNNTTIPYINYMFRRAPGFFDEVCYTGTGPASVPHNLGVPPFLIIAKARSVASDWFMFTSNGTTNFSSISLNSNSGGYSEAGTPASYGHTATTFDTSGINGSGSGYPGVAGVTYVAYLFATCPGVSKVGSYTGTGTTQTINCGFTAGARFVLIKRTDSTGDWYVWDSARGIVAGNDPYLLLNSTAAEVTNTDYVDTAASGFEISSTAPAAINANGGSFIFLAVS